MTIDELLQQLMKIKEIYPDSGRWLVSIENIDYGIEWLPKTVKRNGNSNEIVIK